MRNRAFGILVFLLASIAGAAPASAQYGVQAASDRATGETYHVEVGGYFWAPGPKLSITSEQLGIIGSTIDFIEDLQIEGATFRQIKAVLRPGTKHKLRFEFTPIRYHNPTSILVRNIIFNGIQFPIALPVDTEVKWNAFRFGYEWDFFYHDRGFVGLLLEAKYTDIEATLSNVIDTEFVRARAPIPAIGIIGRGYVAPNISITGEFSGFKLPGGINEDIGGKFFDFDLYGTVNFTDHFGAQFGYRSFDVFYKADEDEGSLTLKGLYFGACARF
jgi:hypothetical protein